MYRKTDCSSLCVTHICECAGHKDWVSLDMCLHICVPVWAECMCLCVHIHVIVPCKSCWYMNVWSWVHMAGSPCVCFWTCVHLFVHSCIHKLFLLVLFYAFHLFTHFECSYLYLYMCWWIHVHVFQSLWSYVFLLFKWQHAIVQLCSWMYSWVWLFVHVCTLYFYVGLNVCISSMYVCMCFWMCPSLYVSEGTLLCTYVKVCLCVLSTHASVNVPP